MKIIELMGNMQKLLTRAAKSLFAEAYQHVET